MTVYDKAAALLNERRANGETFEQIAADLSKKVGRPISDTLLWKVANGRSKSKTVLKALGLARQQIRLAATVNPEERKKLLKLAESNGMTWTEFCKALVR